MIGWELAAYLGTGVLSGLLAGLFGLGGGVVVVPALIWVFGALDLAPGWAPHLAVGTSLATIVATGSASVRAHHRRGAVRWDLVARLAPAMIAGAWLGAAVAGMLDPHWLRRIFALFLLWIGLHMLQGAGRATARTTSLPGAMGIGLAGTGIGAFSALVGIGGGTLTVPFLARAGVEMRHAVATAGACGVPIATAGAIGFVVSGWGRAELPPGATGFVYWPAVAGILLASVPIAPLGARLAHSLPRALLQRLFGVVVLVVGVELLVG